MINPAPRSVRGSYSFAPIAFKFSRVASNKKVHTLSGSVCDQAPYHSGCPQVVDPEKYCLNNDEPAFCKGIGDICDADGFVKPEDAYCDIFYDIF